MRVRTDSFARSVHAAWMSLQKLVPGPIATFRPAPNRLLREHGVNSQLRMVTGDLPVRAAAAAKSLTDTRILIADTASSAEPLTRLLHSLGYLHTKSVVTGASALELARAFQPSIGFIALDLPDMSTAYIGRRLREWASAGQLRLIALAADHSLASRDRARLSGFSRYLIRPVACVPLQQALRGGPG